jgi:tyrosyl-tRNA synthetase
MQEVEEYGKLQGADLRKAKEVLAFEATKIVHGEKEAEKARAASRALFSEERGNEASIPTTPLSEEEIKQGIPIFRLFEMTGLCTSGSEARRLIEQGGGYLNQKRVDRFDALVCRNDFQEKGEILLRAGKKKFHRIKLLDN